MTQAQKLKDKVKGRMKNMKEMWREGSERNERCRAEIESTRKKPDKLRCPNKQEEIGR